MDFSNLAYLALADRLLPAVLAAGALEVEHQRRGVTVERKDDDSPVTIADREAEALLVAAIAAAAPGVPVVGEEAVAAGCVPAIGRRFFLVDALDGTKSFVRGQPEFTVNVALIEDRRATFGVVYAPAMQRLYAALGPATAVEADAAPSSEARRFQDLGCRPVHTRQPDRARLAALASRSHNTAETEELLTRWAVAERRNIGSSLKFCLVARGDADVYPRLGSISEWDTAAGHAVLDAAGGLVTTRDGSELLYGNIDKMFKNQYFIAWGNRDLATLLT